MTKQQRQIIEAILAAAFNKPRDPRSPEYKAGVKAALTFRLAGIHSVLPYTLGTARADAWFSGTDEGHHLWRNLPEAVLMPASEELPAARAPHAEMGCEEAA